MRVFSIILVALTVLALTGCTHTHQVTRAEYKAEQPCQSRRCTVALENGDRFPSMSLRIDPDSTSWIDPRTDALRKVSTAEVVEVRRIQRKRAARGGLVLGLASGVVLGAATGYLVERSKPPAEKICSFRCYTPERHDVTTGMVIGSLSGSALGLLIGGIRGNREVYRFEPLPPAAADSSLTSLQRPVLLFSHL